MSSPIDAPQPLVPRAGFFIRLRAVLVDTVLLSLVGIVLGKAFGQDVFTAGDGEVSYALTGVPALLLMVVSLAYYTYLEGTSGRTLGKRLVGIRVVDAAGVGPIGYGRAAIRFVGRIASAVPLFLGYFWMLGNRNKQTWHDSFATAVVVREPE